MFPAIDQLSRAEILQLFTRLGATLKEAQALLKLPPAEIQEAIRQAILRLWEDDTEWASQIIHNMLVKMGIRQEMEGISKEEK